ncbi:MAG TPA: hypothetical protein VK428_10400 [Acidimicrobiales bacterium]|nr:hypothetical protein [Acidimicrobiales bacterium]
MITIESCHNTWLFDPARMRFRRVVKGTGQPPASTQWRPYYELSVDEASGTFVVTLDAAGRRLLRSWRHPADCTECAEHRSVEFPVDALTAARR